MKRPKRLNYPNGIYGDISYTKQLNKYITYLENKNKALQLLQPDVIKSVCDHPYAFVMSKCNGEINHCLKCGEYI